MKKIITTIIIILVLNLITYSNVLSIENFSATIYVDDDGGADYTKIQDAIDNSTDGDTIVVYNGTYTENILINKKLDIIGSGDSNIIGMDEIEDKPVVLIKEDRVTLDNFIIHGFFDGIFLYGVDDCLIINNYIINNEIGIYLIESFGNTISNNLISQNTKCGIMLQRCAHDYILSNDFASNEGITIFIYASANNEIEYNNFQNNKINAFIINSPVNYWEENYWNRARIFPKIIFGFRAIMPWVNFDWHPATEPYDLDI